MRNIIIFLFLAINLFGANDFVKLAGKKDTTFHNLMLTQKFNEARYRAGYDSVEQVFVHSDSTVADSVVMLPGWIVMEPGKSDTLTNKRRIHGTSNVKISAPPDYEIHYFVNDSTGIGNELGLFYFVSDSNFIIDGGTYICHPDSTQMTEFVMGLYFDKCENFIVQNATFKYWGGDCAYVRDCKNGKFINCTFENHVYSTTPLNGRNCVALVSNPGDSLVGVEFIGCTFKGRGRPANVDIEPNSGGIIKDVLFDACIFAGEDSAGVGFEIYLGSNVYAENIKLSNSFIYGFDKGTWINCNDTTGTNHKNIVIDNVESHHNSTYGFYLLNSKNVVHQNCSAFENTIGWDILPQAEGATLINCKAFDNTSTGFYVDGRATNDAEDIQFINCSAYGNGSHGAQISYVTNGRVIGSKFYGNTGYGFRYLYCSDGYLNDNWIYGNTSSNDLYRFGCTDIYEGLNYYEGANEYWFGLRNPRFLLTDGTQVVKIEADSIASSNGAVLQLNNFRNSATAIEIQTNKNEVRWYNSAAATYAYHRASYFISNVGSGISPYQTTSTTLNANLNADLLDGHHWSEITAGYWTLTGSDIYYDSGNVGIGTTTPNYLLDVDGDMRIANINFDPGASRNMYGPGAGDGLYLYGTPNDDIGFISMWGRNHYSKAAGFELRGYDDPSFPGHMRLFYGASAHSITSYLDIYFGNGSSHVLTTRWNQDQKLLQYFDFQVNGNVIFQQDLDVWGDLTFSGNLTANWDAGNYEIRAQTFESDVATGTKPLTVASTTMVTNFNSNYLSGYSFGDFLLEDGTNPLTGDWDIGDGRMIQTDKIRARDGDGLALHEDGGSGIFIEDGGQVGIGTSSPGYLFDVNGIMHLDKTYYDDYSIMSSGAESIPTRSSLVDGEIHGNLNFTPNSDYGFLRLSAGGMATISKKAGIDIQGRGSTDEAEVRIWTGGNDAIIIDNDDIAILRSFKIGTNGSLVDSAKVSGTDFIFYIGTNSYSIAQD